MAEPNRTIRRNPEAGYTLLIAVFLVATMIIAAAVATPSILTEGRRQKEEDMVWRGNQYARAIGLYYKKFGKFPTKTEDLTNQTNGVRFLRQTYKDPMNKEDGSWRFIYVGPNGQLIGSNNQTSLLQGAVAGAGFPGLQGMSGPLGGTMGQLVNNAQNMQPGMGAPGLPVVQVPGSGGSSSSSGSSSSGSMFDNQPQSLGGATMGGNIIGVGSKVDRSSLRVYLGAANYKDWEFIWNPLSLRAAPGQTPVNPNAPGSAPNGLQAPPPTVNVPPAQ
jgi:type II secretory pathway pseudopilin PulG